MQVNKVSFIEDGNFPIEVLKKVTGEGAEAELVRILVNGIEIYPTVTQPEKPIGQLIEVRVRVRNVGTEDGKLYIDISSAALNESWRAGPSFQRKGTEWDYNYRFKKTMPDVPSVDIGVAYGHVIG